MISVQDYEYGFEIESILKQFSALIDKAIVLRYEKVENERALVQTIQPTYKFATKSRALLLSLNSAKNFVLPCVVIEVKGIKADKQRLAAKNHLISRYKNAFRRLILVKIFYFSLILQKKCMKKNMKQYQKNLLPEKILIILNK